MKAIYPSFFDFLRFLCQEIPIKSALHSLSWASEIEASGVFSVFVQSIQVP
jgi:hypothetical protein